MLHFISKKLIVFLSVFCLLSISIFQCCIAENNKIKSTQNDFSRPHLDSTIDEPDAKDDEMCFGSWSQLVGDYPIGSLQNGFNNSHNINLRGKSTFSVNGSEYLFFGTGNINKKQQMNKSVFFPILKAYALLTKLLLNSGSTYFTKFFIRNQRILDLFVVNSIEQYFKQLTSDGCEIWYLNETNRWKQSVGNETESIISNGFNNSNNLELTLLTPFQTKENIDYLYAGTWNPKQGCELWRTTDPLQGAWEPIIHLKGNGNTSNGFGNPNNTAAYAAATLNEWLYIGTMNWENGCELWRTDGNIWQQVIGGEESLSTLPHGFSKKNRLLDRNIYAWELCVYNDSTQEHLYVGTFNIAGCELWRTSNGITWECLVGDRGQLKRGFTHVNMPLRLLNYGIRRMIVYKDELYIGTASTPSFHFRLNNIDHRSPECIIKMLEVLSPGFEIWKYNGLNFSKVVGKKLTEDDGKNLGFNDRTNTYCWSMEVYNGLLFVGTMNPGVYLVNLTEHWENFIKCNISFEFTNGLCDYTSGGGCEIWYTHNGDKWQQMIGDEIKSINDRWLGNGFDDSNNIGARILTTFNNRLYAGIMNGIDGCEVWSFNGQAFPNKKPIQKENITFESNGYTLYGELYYPTIQNKSHPALVFCEGLPAYVSAYSWLAKSLAQKGYIVILYDPPGLGRSEGLFSLRNISFQRFNLFFRFGSYAETPYHYLHKHWSTAASDALTYLLTNSSVRDHINQDKLGIIGHSLGGITATETAARDHRFKAVVSLSHANPISMRRISVPVQFICGDNDLGLLSLPISKLCYKLSNTPKECIYLRYSTHIGFTTAFGKLCPCPNWQKNMIVRYATGWFDFFLKEEEDAFTIITSKTAYLSRRKDSMYNLDGENIIIN